MPEDIVKCSYCGTESENLRKCKRCGSAAYCDRDCQRAHWKEHKQACNEIVKIFSDVIAEQDGDVNIGGFTAPFPDRQVNLNQQTEAVKQQPSQSKFYRKAVREGEVLTVSSTAQGMVMPGQPLPDGVPAGFPLKQQAHTLFLTGPASYAGKKLGNFQHEKAYRDYYDDLVENEKEWMEFFDHPLNYEHAEHSCGILGTFATIYRKRLDKESQKKCEEVLNMEVKLLAKYKKGMDIAAPTNTNDHYINYDGLEFKMHVIQFNLYRQMGQDEKCVPLFRKMIGYEIKYNMDYEQQNFLWMLQLANVAPTAANARKLSKINIMKIINKLKEMENSQVGRASEQADRERVELKSCAACYATESAIGDFKSCSRCDNSVFYCHRNCQKQHWKVHKKVCNKQ